jgi:hypothetical protein
MILPHRNRALRYAITHNLSGESYNFSTKEKRGKERLGKSTKKPSRANPLSLSALSLSIALVLSGSLFCQLFFFVSRFILRSLTRSSKKRRS